MPIRVLAVGKKHQPWVVDGIKRYETRLKRPWNLEWVILSHSSLAGDSARQDESERLLDRVQSNEFVVLLDERGSLLDSPSLSKQLIEPLERSQPIVMIIGGAYGVTADVHERANLVWSLSPLVFPHQLVRLIVAEQLYRSQEIAAGRPYHHN